MKTLLAGAAALLLVPNVASAAVVYQNNLTGATANVVTTGTYRTDNGVAYLSYLTQGATTTVTIDTSGFTNLALAFRLYAVRSLDGNGPAGGAADPFTITDASGLVFNYNFANYSDGGNTQSYGGLNVPPGSFAPRTGQTACNTLGYGCGNFGDANYDFSGISVTGVGNTLTLTFVANSNQDIGDEFYGLANLVVTGDAVTSAIPEPATWATMLLGFAMVGGTVRRRRTSATVAYSWDAP